MPGKRTTLPPAIKKLTREVFAALDEWPLSGKDNEQMAKEDPEACLVALLKEIKERLPEVYAMLHSTVDSAAGTAAVAKRQAEHQVS